MTAVSTEIDSYLAGVRAALADVPPDVRDDLLEDLPDHLAEVLDEGEGSLVERLGPPADYAAELRTAAGLAPLDDAALPKQTPIRDAVRAWMTNADAKLGPVVGYERFGELLSALRPAWWVLRGAVAAMVLGALVLGSPFLAVLLLLPAIGLSISVGRRSVGTVGWRRVALVAVAGVTMLGLLGVFGALADDGDPYGTTVYPGDGRYLDPFGHVSDVYVYDREGKLVPDARIYDQNGAPLQLGADECIVIDPKTGEVVLTYPRYDESQGRTYPICRNRPGPFDRGPAPLPGEPANTATPTAPSTTSARPTPTATKTR